MIWIMLLGLLGWGVGYALRKKGMFFLLAPYEFPASPTYENTCFLEIVTALCSAIVAWRFPDIEWSVLLILLLTWGLITLAFIDGEYLILPDNLIKPLWALGITANFFYTFVTPFMAILGSSIGYFSLWLLAKTYFKLTKRVGLGQGDIKLFGLLGAWVGLTFLPFILWVASLSGLLFAVIGLSVKKKSYYTPIPFGPFLALGGWISLLMI